MADSINPPEEETGAVLAAQVAKIESTIRLIEALAASGETALRVDRPSYLSLHTYLRGTSRFVRHTTNTRLSNHSAYGRCSWPPRLPIGSDTKGVLENVSPNRCGRRGAAEAHAQRETRAAARIPRLQEAHTEFNGQGRDCGIRREHSKREGVSRAKLDGEVERLRKLFSKIRHELDVPLRRKSQNLAKK